MEYYLLSDVWGTVYYLKWQHGYGISCIHCQKYSLFFCSNLAMWVAKFKNQSFWLVMDCGCQGNQIACSKVWQVGNLLQMCYVWVCRGKKFLTNFVPKGCEGAGNVSRFPTHYANLFQWCLLIGRTHGLLLN